MNAHRPLLAATLLGLGSLALSAAPLCAQTGTEVLERLRRDQDEILRKAERLQALMQRLQARYEREGKKEQVDLLKQGLEHLDRSGMLRDVASIRDDLAAVALTEALRKQREVVEDLERLLNILLERNSVENLDQQMQLTAEQAATARQLEQRQRQLQQQTQQALRTEPTAAEKALLDALRDLQRAEQAEAERNAQQAGSRRPFLESALQRVQELLRQQDRLEQGIAAEDAGRTGENRERQFDLGSLTQRARDLAGQLRDQTRQQELGKAAENLRTEAAGNDQQGLQQARDRFESLLQNAPKQPGGSEGPARDPKWSELRDAMQQAPAGATPTERQQLQELGATGEKLAAQRQQEAQERNAAESASLQQDAKRLAERLAKDPASPPAKDSAAQSLQDAQQQLAEAEAATRAGETPKAQEKVNQAISSLERAREQDQKQNPDAQQQASQMAAESGSTAQELQNAPSAEDAERSATEKLRGAEQALRAAESGIEQAREAGRKPDVKQAAETARQQLEQARDTLQQALQGSTQDRAEDLQAAAERQQQLQQSAERAQQQLQQASQGGQITPEQQKAASEQVQKAQQHMQDAAQKLQQGQQASASSQQQQAAEALKKAGEQLQQNKPLTEQQKQALQDQAKQQEDLAEDIVKLAEELKKRENKAAERAVQQAADAARKAQRAMERGDEEETQEQQEEAREKLEQAAKELEEEQDRYQDLRQEELLFRMKDELTSFLERQRPITAQTIESQQAATADGLSRPARRKLNQLAEEEQELAGKVEFLTNALSEEGNLVYQAVLKANLEDLREVARRLSGRAPDPGNYTTMLQQDVERRTEELLKALERERQRREQERKDQQQQQQQQQGENKFNPQREKLVSLIAELEMLKQLGVDTRRATNDLRTLVESRGDEAITDPEVSLVERLAHRHAEITKLFQQIKAGVEEAMQAMQGGEQEGEGQGGDGRRGR